MPIKYKKGIVTYQQLSSLMLHMKNAICNCHKYRKLWIFSLLKKKYELWLRLIILNINIFQFIVLHKLLYYDYRKFNQNNLKQCSFCNVITKCYQ